MCLFALAFVEIRAINHDKDSRDKDQRAAIAEERQHFGAIGEGIKGAIAAGDKQFAAVTKQNQDAFDATMSRFSSTTSRLGEIAKSQSDIVGVAKETLAETIGSKGYAWIIPDPPYTRRYHEAPDGTRDKYELWVLNSEKTGYARRENRNI